MDSFRHRMIVLLAATALLSLAPAVALACDPGEIQCSDGATCCSFDCSCKSLPCEIDGPCPNEVCGCVPPPCSASQTFCGGGTGPGKRCCDNATQECVNNQCCATGTGCSTVCCGAGTQCAAPGVCCAPMQACPHCAPSATCCDDKLWVRNEAGNQCIAPHDMVAPLADVNPFKVNPTWNWEVAAGNSDPSNNPKNRCGQLNLSSCSYAPQTVNTSTRCACNCAPSGPTSCSGPNDIPCGILAAGGAGTPSGYINREIIELHGALSFVSTAYDYVKCGLGCTNDDNYYYSMFVPKGLDGAKVDYTRRLIYDPVETIRRYKTPWWSAFRAADNTSGKQSLVKNLEAVAVGMLDINATHMSLETELHPVFGMAVHLPTVGQKSDKWALFLHQNLDQGYCASNRVSIGGRAFAITLPWRPGATSVVMDSAKSQLEGRCGSASVNPDPGKSVTVYADLDPSCVGNPWVEMELYLNWDGPSAGWSDPAWLSAARTRSFAPVSVVSPRDARFAIARPVSQLPAAKQAAFRKQMGSLRPSDDQKVQAKPPARWGGAGRAGESVVATAPHMVPDPEGDLHKQLGVRAVRETLGDQTPEFLKARTKKRR